MCSTCKNLYKRKKSISVETAEGTGSISLGGGQSYMVLDQHSDHGREDRVNHNAIDCKECSPSSIDDANILKSIFSFSFLREAFSQLSYKGSQKTEIEVGIAKECQCQEVDNSNNNNNSNSNSDSNKIDSDNNDNNKRNGIVGNRKNSNGGSNNNHIISSSNFSPIYDLSDNGEKSRNNDQNLEDDFSDSTGSQESPLGKHNVAHQTISPQKRYKRRMGNAMKYTHTDMLSIAIVLCPLWFIANCCYNYALLYTSVASSTVISNLSGGFTLFFSWLYGVEQITVSKLLGLSICFVGVGLVAMADSNRSNQSTVGDMVDQSTVTSLNVLGDLMAVLGAAGYGLYTTVLRVKVTDDDSASMQLLLGYMGLVNAIILSPVLFLMVSWSP